MNEMRQKQTIKKKKKNGWRCMFYGEVTRYAEAKKMY